MIETIKALKVILIRIITKSMGFHYTIAASSPFRFALSTELFFARCNRQSTRPLHCCLRWRETHRLDKHCSCTLFAHILARVSPRWLFDASATRRLRDGWTGWNQCAREILTSVPRRRGGGRDIVPCAAIAPQHPPAASSRGCFIYPSRESLLRGEIICIF